MSFIKVKSFQELMQEKREKLSQTQQQEQKQQNTNNNTVDTTVVMNRVAPEPTNIDNNRAQINQMLINDLATLVNCIKQVENKSL